MQGGYDVMEQWDDVSANQAQCHQGSALGHDLLDYCILGDHQAVARALMEQPQSIDIRDDRGQTAAHLAAWYGKAEVLAVLIQADPTILGARDHTQQMPAHLAAWNGHDDVLRVIQAHDPNTLSACNLFGSTPAHSAAMGGHPVTVALICEFEPRLWNMRNGQGKLPLEICGPIELGSRGGELDLLMGFSSLTFAGGAGGEGERFCRMGFGM